MDAVAGAAVGGESGVSAYGVSEGGKRNLINPQSSISSEGKRTPEALDTANRILDEHGAKRALPLFLRRQTSCVPRSCPGSRSRCTRCFAEAVFGELLKNEGRFDVHTTCGYDVYH
jgi:hypothetical protein